MYFGYDYQAIESISTNLTVERSNIKLFRHLSIVEDLLTISTLKYHLQTLNRFELIRLIDGQQHHVE